MTLASAHLLEERDKLDSKIMLLQEERDLINKHLANQEQKQSEVVINVVNWVTMCNAFFFLSIDTGDGDCNQGKNCSSKKYLE